MNKKTQVTIHLEADRMPYHKQLHTGDDTPGSRQEVYLQIRINILQCAVRNVDLAVNNTSECDRRWMTRNIHDPTLLTSAEIHV